MRIEIDGGGYVSACSEFYTANHGITDLMTTLTGDLDGGAGMAGTDTGGEQFASQYDAAAAQLVQTGCDLGTAMANVANLLNASLVNHAGADHGATVGGGPNGGGPTGDDDPDHYTEELYAPAPPSAAGGTGDQPGWWHWIASHVEGLLWPDADTGKLRSVGNAWKTAGTTLSSYTAEIDAAKATVGTQQSPEVPHATAGFTALRQHVTDTATNFGSLGQACLDYADQVDAHHQEVLDELASFIEWTIAIEAAGGILSVVTVGISEAAAQAAEAAEVANAAQKVIRILNDLIELARLAASKLGEALEAVAKVAVDLKKFLSAKVVAFLEKAGVTAAKVDLDSLPAWATREVPIPTSGPGSDLYAGMTEADRYGGMTKQEFYDTYWDKEKGTWKWPENNGFAGAQSANDLKTGDVIDRFGGAQGGEYAADAGDSYGQRAMPPSNIGREYHQYVVEKPLPPSVTQGKIADAFGQPGGGTQYNFADHDIDWYVQNGYLRELK